MEFLPEVISGFFFKRLVRGLLSPPFLQTFIKNYCKKASSSSFLDFNALEWDLLRDRSKLSILAPRVLPESVLKIELMQD
jgi:hypothetical protein